MRFAVKPGGAMYLPPEQRISLWPVEREMGCGRKAPAAAGRRPAAWAVPGRRSHGFFRVYQ